MSEGELPYTRPYYTVLEAISAAGQYTLRHFLILIQGLFVLGLISEQRKS